MVNAVKFSRAGLNEEHKPVASFLFVGPTGVGKTELAKALAEELGIAFLRFDMSEYAEKHTVAREAFLRRKFESIRMRSCCWMRSRKLIRIFSMCCFR